MSRSNKISAQLDPGMAQDILNQIQDQRNKLPFLLNLSIEERKAGRKKGAKSASYVSDCRDGANQFSQFLSQDFPKDEFNKDVDLIEALTPIYNSLASFTEALNDTLMAAGMDCMEQADEVYAALKNAANRDGNVKTIVEKIGKRFEGQGTRKPKKTI